MTSTHGKPGGAKDRRTHDRVPARVQMQADHEGRQVPITAMNLSEGGAYCLSEVPFPLMTRLEVGIEIPNGTGADSMLHLPAVVVRCEPHPTVGANWNLALFFANPSPAVRDRLASFLQANAGAVGHAGSSTPRSSRSYDG